jgi:hypothetical protein
MRPTTFKEVTQTVMSMEIEKLLGPDGFIIYLFQACWSDIRKDAWEVVEESRSSRNIVQTFDYTFLELIPKYL